MYWITGILGLVLTIAPFALGYSNDPAALWTSLLIGGITLFVSLIEWMKEGREEWEYWTAATLGIAGVVAPFILGFSGQTTAMWTSVVAGILIALFAGSKLTSGQWRGT